MNFQDKYIGIIGLGKSGYWSAKLARSLDYNVFISDINMKSKIDAQFIKNTEDLSKFIKTLAEPGDLVLFIGAGDINIISSEICLKL